MSERKTKNIPIVKVCRPMGKDGLGERWAQVEIGPTLNTFDYTGDTRAVVLVVTKKKRK